MKRKKWSPREILAGLALTLLTIALCGCGKEEKDLPEDTPWNHGFNAIMETDAGYYSNLMDEMHLCYYDKATGNAILLCNKPECQHEGGDECEATYHNMRTINTLLYDGYLYLLGVEEEDHVVSISLYRGALDGSSMDKIGTVISKENTKDQEYMIFNPRSQETTSFCNDNSAFIIHKGYAYIPYYLRFGQGMKGFMGGGLVKMDVRTGEMKELYANEHANSDTPRNLVGAGDYVYFDLGFENHRYVISEDRIEDCTWGMPKQEDMAQVTTVQEIIIPQISRSGTGLSRCYTKEKVYAYAAGTLTTYDAVTMESLGEPISMELPKASITRNSMGNIQEQKVRLYEDTLLIANAERAFFYNLSGEFLGELAIPEDVKTHENAFGLTILDYKFHDGRVYLINRYVWPSHQWFRVFSCEIEDIFQGAGAWKEVYRIEGIDGAGK